MKNTDIPEYEIDGLIQTMKETGIKGLMKYTHLLGVELQEEFVIR